MLLQLWFVSFSVLISIHARFPALGNGVPSLALGIALSRVSEDKVWARIVIGLASEAYMGLEQLVKLALVVNRFNELLEPAPVITDDTHYIVSWRGFWSRRVERIVRLLADRGVLVRKDGCFRASRVDGVDGDLGVRIRGVVAHLGILTGYELDREIAMLFSKAIGVPILLEHVIGARVSDLAPIWPPRKLV